MDTRAMIAERVELNEKARAMLDKADREKRTLNADESQTFDRMQTRINELRATLDAEALVEAEERHLGQSRGRQTQTTTRDDGVEPGRDERGTFGPRPRTSPQDLALRGWALGARATRPMLEAAESIGMSTIQPELDMRALSEGTTSAGGYSVPNEMMRAYSEALKWFGAVRNTSTIVTTATGATLPWPTADDTTNTGEIITEGSAVTTTADPTFGIVNFSAYKFSSKAVIVSVELLQDSFIDLPVFLGRELGTRIGRIQNTKFTVGTGTGEPNGIVVASTLGKTATATNAFTFDEVIDLVHSVDPAYRSAPGTGFMLHDTVLAYARKLKDSQNRYLWEMSTQVGVPDRMFGYPVSVNNDMSAAFTTGQKLMLFGWLNAYIVRDAGPIVILRADELRILNHQSVFVSFMRSDSNLPLTAAIRHLKLA